ncbi:MAG: hypothetical protein WCD86_02990 [Ktedonobacteraceae bacterium]
MSQFVPNTPLEGRTHRPVPQESIVAVTLIELVPFTALMADHRTFSMDAKVTFDLTYPTGSGSTNQDGGEITDEPMEDDEFKP